MRRITLPLMCLIILGSVGIADARPRFKRSSPSQVSRTYTSGQATIARRSMGNTPRVASPPQLRTQRSASAQENREISPR